MNIIFKLSFALLIGLISFVNVIGNSRLQRNRELSKKKIKVTYDNNYNILV